MLDETDQKLIRILKSDSRISNADLAERAGLSASSCWRRVKALETSGVIGGYTIEVSDKALGLEFAAIVHVQLTRHQPDLLTEFIRKIQTREEIRACYATTGQSDYHLHVVCRDIAAYNLFLENFLFQIKAVSSAQTNVVLRVLKS